jgi:hypothetical protein
MHLGSDGPRGCLLYPLRYVLQRLDLDGIGGLSNVLHNGPSSGRPSMASGSLRELRQRLSRGGWHEPAVNLSLLRRLCVESSLYLRERMWLLMGCHNRAAGAWVTFCRSCGYATCDEVDICKYGLPGI